LFPLFATGVIDTGGKFAAGGEDDYMKKPEAKNLVTLSFKL
jgi:hypothetical protein